MHTEKETAEGSFFQIAVTSHQSMLLIKALSPCLMYPKCYFYNEIMIFLNIIRFYYCAYMFIPGIPGPPKAFSGGLIAPP